MLYFLYPSISLFLFHCKYYYFIKILIPNLNCQYINKWLAIRELKIKTTMKYYLTLVRMAITEKSTNHKCCIWFGEKGTLLHCWWQCKLVQPLWKTVWRYLKKKVKIELSCDLAIPLLAIYSERNKLVFLFSFNIYPGMFHVWSFYRSQGLQVSLPFSFVSYLDFVLP